MTPTTHPQEEGGTGEKMGPQSTGGDEPVPSAEGIRSSLAAAMPENSLRVELRAGHISAASEKVAACGRQLQTVLREKLRLEDAEFADAERMHITVMTGREISFVVDQLARELQETLPAGITMQKAELGSLAREKVRGMIGAVDQDWTLRGIGTAGEGTDRAYYGVVEWPGGLELRRRFAKYGINPSALDFHLTLAWQGKDVHGVRKNVAYWTVDGEILQSTVTETTENDESVLEELDLQLQEFDRIAPLVYADNARGAVDQSQMHVLQDPSARSSAKKRLSILEKRGDVDDARKTQIAQAKFMIAEEKIDVLFQLRNRLSALDVHPKICMALATMIENDVLDLSKVNITADALHRASLVLIHGTEAKLSGIDIVHNLKSIGLPAGAAAFLYRQVSKDGTGFEQVAVLQEGAPQATPPDFTPEFQTQVLGRADLSKVRRRWVSRDQASEKSEDVAGIYIDINPGYKKDGTVRGKEQQEGETPVLVVDHHDQLSRKPYETATMMMFSMLGKASKDAEAAAKKESEMAAQHETARRRESKFSGRAFQLGLKSLQPYRNPDGTIFLNHNHIDIDAIISNLVFLKPNLALKYKDELVAMSRCSDFLLGSGRLRKGVTARDYVYMFDQYAADCKEAILQNRTPPAKKE